jgi:hypothetical protein
MVQHTPLRRLLAATGLALAAMAPAHAVQFSSLAAGLTQEIYAGPFGSSEKPDLAWSTGGHLLLRFNSQIYEYDTATTVVNGTSVHTPIATHIIPALSAGWGMASGPGGLLYANTVNGLVEVHLGSTSVTPLTANEGMFGIEVLDSGKVAYAEKTSPNKLRLYDPGTASNNIIYTAASDFIDDIAQADTGELVVVDMGAGRVDILTPDATEATWTKTNSFVATADGLAFWNGKLYASNTDGNVYRVDFSGPGLSGTPSFVAIASGGPSSFGDFAEVGPDNALYVLQNNFTRWDNGSVTNQSSLIRISAVPEPSSALLLMAGGLGLAAATRRQRSPAR